jgi:hypothetical protein
VILEFGEDSAGMGLVDDQDGSRASLRIVLITRSQWAFIRGALGR